jgi:Enterobacterial TraT complement resistance protein.
MFKRKLSITKLVIGSVFALYTCASFGSGLFQTKAASKTSASGLSAGNVKVFTRMSSSIFLQPVPASEKVIYVVVRNTSTASNINFTKDLVSVLKKEGYTITDDPQKAHFILMANVLYIGKETKDHTVAGALAGGFGGAVVGNAVSSGGEGSLVGGLFGSLVGGIVGHMIQKDSYMMVVDIQLEERAPGTYTTTSTLASQGTNTIISTHNAAIKGWQIYRDRLVSGAEATNLDFASAEPVLKKQMAHSIGNLLP